MTQKILITGASGCVGQYTASWLLENSQAKLLLWVRDPNKLTAIPKNHPRVQLLIGDLRKPTKFSNELFEVTRVIHTATAWGDIQRAEEVNVIAVKALLELLNPEKIEQITYFSTASILDKDLKPLPEALIYGTEYIQTKAKCLHQLENHPLASKIIAIFPTLVFGGSIDGKSIFPTSYLTKGLTEVSKWLWLARFIKAYSRFHFIHAADIAFICGQIATQPYLPRTNEKSLKKFVLGQQAISVDQAVDTLCKWRRIKKTPRLLPLSKWLVELLITFLPIQLTPWDRFSIKQRHFVHYPVTTPELFGGKSYASTLIEVLTYSGLINKQPKRS